MFKHLIIFVTLIFFYSFNFNFKVGYYNIENLYSEDNFLDISISLIL